MEKKHTRTIPKAPGIYLFKDRTNTVIYIGKAKDLAKRVNSYFYNKNHDWKVVSLINDYTDIDYILTTNETEALLLEAQLVKEHKPKYNVLLRDGQPYIYIVFTKDTTPTIKLVRNKKGAGTFFGPFFHKSQARSVHRYLTETFRLFVCNKKIPNGCLDFHLGRCAGTCTGGDTNEDYLFRLELAKDVLRKNHKKCLKALKEKVAEYSANLEFEKARRTNEYVQNLDIIFTTLETKFSEKKFAHEAFVKITPTINVPDDYNATALTLQKMFDLPNAPRTIDCFDISHFQSKFIVGSCVRFANGKPDKNNFRRFKIKTLDQQNDYAALQEIATRRYRNPENIPDLVLIDGGKGQLNAVRAVLPNATCISLAKREETIFSPATPQGVKLDVQTEIGKLLIALRDYAHHFAIEFHRKQRSL